MIQPWNLLVCITLGGPGVKTYTSCSHSCHFTATTCFEAFSTPISKSNVDAMVVTPLLSKQLPNSKAILTHKGPTWVSSGPSTNGAEDSSHTARLRTNFSLELDWGGKKNIYIYIHTHTYTHTHTHSLGEHLEIFPLNKGHPLWFC